MRRDVPSECSTYFEGLYARHADPWRYDTCRYEIHKRADTLSFLRDRYARACEIGCSNGVLTEQLALRCNQLVAVDSTEGATAQTRARLVHSAHVEIRQMHVPYQDLDGKFDLLVLSEVLYLRSAPELTAMAALAERRVVPGGDLIIVSYDGATETELTGRQATDRFLQETRAEFKVTHSRQRQGYHVRLLQRRHARA